MGLPLEQNITNICHADSASSLVALRAKPEGMTQELIPTTRAQSLKIVEARVHYVIIALGTILCRDLVIAYEESYLRRQLQLLPHMLQRPEGPKAIAMSSRPWM